jgi:methyl-accepting chemotaxis protein
MKLKIKLYAKMLIYILSISAIIFGVSIVVIGLKIKDKALESTREHIDVVSEKNSRKIQGVMNEFMNTSQALTSMYLAYESILPEQRRSDFQAILKSVLKRNPHFLAAWTIWEPNAIDGQDSLYENIIGNTYLGNFSTTYYRNGDSIKMEGLSSGPLFQGSYYTIPKEKQSQTLLEPYFYAYEHGQKEVIQTNMIVPLLYNGQFLGVVGTDASLDMLQESVKDMKPYDDSYAFLIANKGTIVAHKNKELVGKNVDTLSFSTISTAELVAKVKWQDHYGFIDVDPITGKETYFSYTSFNVGKSFDRWVFGVAVPTALLDDTADKIFIISIVAAIFGLILFGIIILIIARSITRPVVRITEILKEISLGNIDNSLKYQNRYNDEITDMADSLNKLIDGLNSTAVFAKKIGEGNLDIDHQLLSKKDFLGKSLVNMRQSLKEAKEFEEKKREADRKQAWVSQGLGKFSEILRQDNDDMQKFSNNIVRNLCDYMEIEQSAIFIVEEEDNKIYYDLKSVYAFGSTKLIDKRIYEGEELIGRSINEKRTIHLQNTPNSFVNITTGKSEDEPPKHLLIVPMLMNDIPYGVLELMSVEPFEEYKVRFTENVAESIAATVSSVKTNIRTAQLLKQSEELKDELSQQEEEMRQNLEEMQATQEEAQKRESELTSIKNTLQSTLMMAEYDLEGRILRINELLAEVYGYTPDNMVGKFQDAFVTQDDASRRNFLRFWQDVITGVTKKGFMRL